LQYNKRKQKIEMTISSLEDSITDTEDEDEISNLEDKISELNDELDEIDSEIEDIGSSPEGDFPDDLIEDKVQELTDDAVYDPAGWLREHGLEMEDFIDKDEFIQGVIDSDGYGSTLSSYDGNADEVDVEGTTYYIIRIN